MSFAHEVIEPKLFAGAAADEIAASVLDVLSEQPRCSIALAGGSTPVAVYRALAVPPRVESIAWEKIDLFLGDERWVPATDTQSNFRMVNENLVSRLHDASASIFAVKTELSSAEQGAVDYEAQIKKHVPAGSDGTPRIDIVLLGMGDDGHTASIFPGSELLKANMSSQPLVAVQPWPNQADGYRLTMTPKLLTAARKIIFLVQGAGKAEMLARALDEKDPGTLPVHLFRKVQDKVSWMVDSEAARLLK